MSVAIDKLYINFVSSRLERFRWIRPTLAICRCPICGDGDRGKKTRFYMYENIKYGSTGYNVDCKNCGFAMSFHSFLKDFDQHLYNQYRLDNFKDKFGREPRQLFSEVEAASKPEVRTKLALATKLSDLPEDHICVRYFKSRKLPDELLSYFMYTENFQKTTASFKDADYAKKMPSDGRMIIPFYTQFGELVCYQGRSLDPANKMRYISIKKTDSADKIFGMDRVDRSKDVRVCEGPIDSILIKNCLASADADLTRVKGDTYIPDFQYKNKDVCRIISGMVEKGVKIVLAPEGFKYKDVNEWVIETGVTAEDIESFIINNTYQGLKARLKFNRLKGT